MLRNVVVFRPRNGFYARRPSYRTNRRKTRSSGEIQGHGVRLPARRRPDPAAERASILSVP